MDYIFSHFLINGERVDNNEVEIEVLSDVEVMAFYIVKDLPPIARAQFILPLISGALLLLRSQRK